MMRIPFGSLPSLSPLFLDYIGNWTRVRNFYPQDYSLESIVWFAKQKPALERAHRERLCAALSEQQQRWDADSRSVEKFAAGAVAVLAGQQPGLFTGPNYTILKALTIIKLAADLEQAGVPAVPVFWVAAEDHDHEEIRWASILDRETALQKIIVELSNGESAPVGWLSFRDDVT